MGNTLTKRWSEFEARTERTAYQAADCNLSASGRHSLRSTDVVRGSMRKQQLWRPELCRRRARSVEPAGSQHATSATNSSDKNRAHIFAATRSMALCVL